MTNSKIQIMLVDAQEIYVSAFKKMFNDSSKVEIHSTVNDGKEALDLLYFNRSLVDIIIIDVTERKKQTLGIAYASYLQKYFPDIKILAQSNQRVGAQIYQLYQAGVQGFIFKDSSSEEISNAIQALSQNKKHYTNEVADLLKIYLEHHSPTYKDNKPYLTSFEKSFLDRESTKWKTSPRNYKPNFEAINWKNITRKLGTKNHIDIFIQFLSSLWDNHTKMVPALLHIRSPFF